MRPYHDIVLWTMQREGSEATAVLRYIEGEGGAYDARFLVDGELRRSRMFTKGFEALEWANQERAELERKGWRRV